MKCLQNFLAMKIRNMLKTPAYNQIKGHLWCNMTSLLHHYYVSMCGQINTTHCVRYYPLLTRSDPPIPILTTSVICLPVNPGVKRWIAGAPSFNSPYLSKIHFVRSIDTKQHLTQVHSHHNAYLTELLHVIQDTIDVRHHLTNEICHQTLNRLSTAYIFAIHQYGSVGAIPQCNMQHSSVL